MELHRLELLDRRGGFVVVSFKTDRHGIYQLGFDGSKKKELEGEPSFHVLRSKEQNYALWNAAIVWRMCFDWDKNL